MSLTRTRALLLVVATTALFATACGDDLGSGTPTTVAPTTTSSAAASAEFNDADVTFLQMMYPHHAQAVEMAQLVPSRTQNAQLIALAAQVEQAQAPEMARITELLTGFGKPAPSAGGHGGHDMPGMMTEAQMSALEAARDAEFDRQWLELMIEHHLGAVDMAETELAGGTNAEARALATSIVADQQAEIDTMRGMLGR
ncbi:DUF305 domain-containing protein [Nocardia sp. AG03]|uniref:DUF305 domain-containing protein n=1 Tax=Nocardia sp. AG03 TaxID=3025312 RepID=UPI002418693E|nr:DUF305 domain-containing protein [Nocardia sp. AG03]